MPLTREQQDEVNKARAAGDKRATISFTAQQKDQWEAAVQEELACKEENIAHLRKIQAAAKQPGFFGDLRRAIAASSRSVGELAVGIGVEQRLLSDFRAGEAELPAAALERLVDTLGLRLMQEIPQ